ncbi:hypothetical protein C9065_21710 [Escherichia coli]|nr:hypothetical protein C9065_21710 [Escherichia coli]
MIQTFYFPLIRAPSPIFPHPRRHRLVIFLTPYYLTNVTKKLFFCNSSMCKRKLTAVCSHQTRIGNLDAHLI